MPTETRESLDKQRAPTQVDVRVVLEPERKFITTQALLEEAGIWQKLWALPADRVVDYFLTNPKMETLRENETSPRMRRARHITPVRGGGVERWEITDKRFVENGRGGEDKMERTMVVSSRSNLAKLRMLVGTPIAQAHKIEKIRYYYSSGGLVFAIDVCEGRNAGSISVDVEFPDREKMAMFVPPPWFGKEAVKRVTNPEKQAAKAMYSPINLSGIEADLTATAEEIVRQTRLNLDE